MKRWTTWVALALALLLAGCTVSAGYPYYARPYPPPAYGDWRWDDDLSLYVNLGYPYLYYGDHVYYRWYEDRWASGPAYYGPWRYVERGAVPPGLWRRYSPRRGYEEREPRWERHDVERRWDRDDARWPRREVEPRDFRREQGVPVLPRHTDERRESQLRELERRRDMLHQGGERRWPQDADGQPRQWQPPRGDAERQPRWTPQRQDGGRPLVAPTPQPAGAPRFERREGGHWQAPQAPADERRGAPGGGGREPAQPGGERGHSGDGGRHFAPGAAGDNR